MTTPSHFPLQWPQGWPRTSPHDREQGRYRYRRGGGFLTMAVAQREFHEEMERLGGVTNLVVSSNLVRNLNGSIRSNQRSPEDPGVAIYFGRNGTPTVMAMDDFTEPECNVRRLTLAIKALRDLERNGGGTMMERAFSGFAALPAPTELKRDCWAILDLGPNSTRGEIKRQWQELAKIFHPDKPEGSASKMAEINNARDEALREVG